jgi:hypothetical protein
MYTAGGVMGVARPSRLVPSALDPLAGDVRPAGLAPSRPPLGRMAVESLRRHSDTLAQPSVRRLAQYREPVRSRLHLFVNSADIAPDRLAELAEQTDVVLKKVTKPGKALGVYEALIEDDLLGAERLRDGLRRSGVEAFIRHERIASAQELLAAPLAALRVDRAERGYGGPRYGTQFVLDSACPTCGSGAKPAGDVWLRASDVPRRGDVFRTYDGEVFFSDRARDRLDRAGVTGAEWHQVRAARTGARLAWAQLVAPIELPPADAETSGGLCARTLVRNATETATLCRLTDRSSSATTCSPRPSARSPT